MIRRFALVFATALAAATPALAQEMGGQITCEREAREVWDYLDANRSMLRPEQVAKAEQQLDVIDSQCRGQVQLGQTNLTVLRNDLTREVAQQQAQMPE
jgi:hypothetical protein